MDIDLGSCILDFIWNTILSNQGRQIPLESGFPGGSASKESACNAKDSGSGLAGSEKSPGEGNGNPLQYSCLENSMDRGAWWASVHEVAKSWT